MDPIGHPSEKKHPFPIEMLWFQKRTASSSSMCPSGIGKKIFEYGTQLATDRCYHFEHRGITLHLPFIYLFEPLLVWQGSRVKLLEFA